MAQHQEEKLQLVPSLVTAHLEEKNNEHSFRVYSHTRDKGVELVIGSYYGGRKCEIDVDMMAPPFPRNNGSAFES